MTETDERVSKAQSDIAAILAKLETETGDTVDAVHLVAVDVTTYLDRNTKHQMAVEITLMRIPGHQW